MFRAIRTTSSTSSGQPRLHHAGIGAILDFVPVHFAVDHYGLRQLDGTALYEYPHRDVGESEWGSYNFNHARGEVASFLQSAANYWLREYHFDGLRMDAVSRLIYWQGDERRGENTCVFGYVRRAKRSALAVFLNFSDREAVISPRLEGKLSLLLDTQWQSFGGQCPRRRSRSLIRTLPPFGGAVYSVT